jgi:hypothetical protein
MEKEREEGKAGDSGADVTVTRILGACTECERRTGRWKCVQ